MRHGGRCRGVAGAGVTRMGRDAVAARSRGDLCRAIARDPTEGVVPEGGARPVIVDEHENGFVVMRDAATLLFSATTTLRVYLVAGSCQEGGSREYGEVTNSSSAWWRWSQRRKSGRDGLGAGWQWCGKEGG